MSRKALADPQTDRARLAFLVFLASSLAAFAWLVLRPLLAPLVVATLVAVIFQPVHRRIERKLGRETVWASAASLLLVTVVVWLPFLGLGLLFVKQSRSVLEELIGLEAGAALSSRLTQLVEQYLDWSTGVATRYFGASVDFRSVGVEAIQSAGAALYEGLPDIVGYAGRMALAYVVLNVTLFFLFLEGRFLVRLLVELSPLGEAYTHQILRRVRRAIEGVFVGYLLTALCQGAIGTVGFLVTGFENWAVWGVLIAGAGLIPIVGTGLVWAPAALYLWLTGEIVQALMLLAFGVLIGTVDNLLRPFLSRGRSAIHPLMLFLAVVGGLWSAGPGGLLYGPLLAAVVVESVAIYRSDYRPQRRASHPEEAA